MSTYYSVFRLKVPKGSSTELTQEGFHFITALFRKFDEVCYLWWSIEFEVKGVGNKIKIYMKEIHPEKIYFDNSY